MGNIPSPSRSVAHCKIVQDNPGERCHACRLSVDEPVVHAYCLAALRFRPWRDCDHSSVVGLCPVGPAGRFLAIDAQFTPLESQGLSAIVFAGAAQLVAIGMVKSGASLIAILLTTLLLTSQHLLYGMHMRATLSPLPARWRMSLGFLLTDEFFALVSQYDRQTFNRWYALGVGLTFYVAWNLFTLAGIVLGKSIPNLDQLGLEFSIAATFIALITPVVRDVPTVVCVAVALLFSVLLSYWHWESAVVVSGLLGMSAGYACKRLGVGQR